MTNLFAHADDNATATLMALVQQLRARVTPFTIRTTLQRHSDYPSLLSLSDALDSWNINNLAAQIKLHQLQDVSLPFVAHLKGKGGGRYVLVKDVGADKLTYFDSTDGITTESLSSFGQKWSGAVLMAELGTKSGEVDYIRNRRSERLQTVRWVGLLVLTTLIFGFLLWEMQTEASLIAWGFCITKTLGFIIGVLLLGHQFNGQTPIAKRICQLGQTGGCSGVLNSSAARLTDWLSWSEIGFLYFSGGLLAILITKGNPIILELIGGLSVLALPYTIYSFVYQGQVAKTWCVLCLLVQALFILEFFLTVLLWPNPCMSKIIGALPIFIFSFLIPIFVYIAFKPLLTSTLKLQRTELVVNRLKYNSSVFKMLLGQQPHMPQ